MACYNKDDKKTWQREDGAVMEKKEVLVRDRNKKKGSMDEWEMQVTQKGFSFALMGVHYLYNGVKLHKKFETGLGIVSALAAVLLFVGYISEIF